MAQTHAGAMKALATRAGVTIDELNERHTRGEKWCYRCREWLPVTQFGVDRSRYDGRASRCATCRLNRNALSPTIPMRRVQRAAGLAWCRGCKRWLPAERVRQGACREHHAAYERHRYATDERYSLSRRHRSAQRKRGVAPIPVEMQISLTEQFEGKCAYCDADAVSYDHIEPVSRGGQTYPGFVVPACRSCNSSKKDRDLDSWLARKNLIAKHVLIDVLVMQHV